MMKNEKESRRSFLRKMAVTGLATTAGLSLPEQAEALTANRGKEKKADEDGMLRIGFIGTGSRSEEHIRNVISIGGNRIVAICDVNPLHLERATTWITGYNVKAPKIYTGHDYAFKEMVQNETLDAVIIASPWEWHVPMSVAAMKAGVPYVAVEVSAANTLEECWDLVNVSEETGSRLFIMENVCYRQDVMACLNMVRQGVFGELIHARCGYEHDLREVKFNDGTNYTYRKGDVLKMGPGAANEAQWRTNHSVMRNGDLYPTHGIGPVANCLNINRGNRFLSISSMATKSRGLHKYIVDNGGAGHELAGVHFNCGDIVTSMLRCANGETVIITHDTNSPRPYSLGFRIQGTNGLWNNDGDTVYVEGQSGPHRWDNSETWFKKYDHRIWKELSEKARNAGHGGMDFMMMYDFLSAVRDKKEVPLDCYDAAAWSAVSALSEMSVARGGAPVDFPDFTRGRWIKREPHFAL